MNRKQKRAEKKAQKAERKACEAILKAVLIRDKALETVPHQRRYEVFSHLAEMWRICAPSDVLVRSGILLDRIKAAGVQAERDRQTAQTQEVYEW